MPGLRAEEGIRQGHQGRAAHRCQRGGSGDGQGRHPGRLPLQDLPGAVWVRLQLRLRLARGEDSGLQRVGQVPINGAAHGLDIVQVSKKNREKLLEIFSTTR